MRRGGGPPDGRESYHRLVGAWVLAADERRELARRNDWPPSARLDETPLDRQALALHSRIFDGLEARGHSLAHEAGSLRPVWAMIGGQRVDVRIYERARQRRIPLTDAEQRQPANAALDRRFRQELVATGRLVVNATARFGKAKHWDAAPGRPLEGRLEEILGGLERLAAAAAERQAELDDWHRRYEASERRRAQREARVQRDADDWAGLRTLARAWAEAERLRRFLTALEAKLPTELETRDPSAAWFAWAHRHIVDLDPLSAENLPGLTRQFRRAPRRRPSGS